MKAVQFKLSIPKYLAVRTLSPKMDSITTSRLSCVSLREIPVPEPFDEQWVRIRTLRAGICGTDLSIVRGKTSFSLEPYGSPEFIFGHEIVGEVVEKGSLVKNVSEGDTVVIEPTLTCITRGIPNQCHNCKRGHTHLCSNLTNGRLSPATAIGFSKETGGGWGEYLVAHRSQLYKLPGSISLKEGVLVEPLAVTLHAVLRRYPPTGGTALVLGSGTIGLLTIAALRMLRLKCKIIATAKYEFQEKLAKEFGANIVVNPSKEDLYEVIARETMAQIFKPSLGKRVVEGGVHCTYDSIGSPSTVDDALRLTQAGGTAVIIGGAGIAKGVELTPVWFREVNLLGSFAYGIDYFRGKKRKTFDMAIDLIKRNKKIPLKKMVTHEFSLDRWKEAIHTAQSKSGTNAVKVVFSFT